MGHTPDDALSIAHRLARQLQVNIEASPGLDPATLAIEMAEAHGVRVPSVTTDEFLAAYRMLDGSIVVVRPTGLEAAHPNELSKGLDGYIFETLKHLGHDENAIIDQAFTVGLAQEWDYRTDLQAHAERRRARWRHMTVEEARVIMRDAEQGLFPQAPAFAEAFECSLQKAREDLVYFASTKIEVHEAVYGPKRRRFGPKP